MKNPLLILALVSVLHCNAQIPDGYYDSAEDLTGEELREELHEIIDGHNQQSYGSLWNHFEFTDKKTNDKVWDMYSTQDDGSADYEYTFGSDQCGNYGSEGDCYNREHSVPASWYNDGYPMYSDLFHLYPTDSTSSVGEFGVRSLELEVRDSQLEVKGNWETVKLYSAEGRLINSWTFEQNEELKIPSNQTVIVVVRNEKAILTERFYLVD